MSEPASQPTLAPAPPLFDVSQQGENVHHTTHTTGYEPNVNLGAGALPGLGVPPPEVMAGGPEAQLIWYLSQQTRLGNGDPVPQATAAAHGTPPGLSQVLGGAPLALPFQGHWGGDVSGLGGVGVHGISTMPNNPTPGTYPQLQNTGGNVSYSPSFAFPIQQQQQLLQSVQQPQFGYETPPGTSLFSGNQQGQQSMLSSLAGFAQAGASALNPLLQALVPQPQMPLIPVSGNVTATFTERFAATTISTTSSSSSSPRSIIV